MKTLIQPKTTTLTQPKNDLSKINRFLNRDEVFGQNYYVHTRINFKESQVIGSIRPYGTYFVDNLKRNYQAFIETECLQDYEKILDIGDLNFFIDYIGEKRKDYQELIDFLKDVSKKHRFSNYNTKTNSYEFYFIDSELIDLESEKAKEQTKINDFYSDLKLGKVPSVPRLKRLKHNFKSVEIDFDLFRYRSVEGVINNLIKRDRKEIEKYFSLVGSIKNKDSFTMSLPSYKPDLEKLSIIVKGFEKLGVKFNQCPVYNQVTKLNVFNELGD